MWRIKFSCTSGETINCLGYFGNNLAIPQKVKHKVNI